MKRSAAEMFLKKSKRPNGRIQLSIVKAYRNPLTGKNAHKQVSYLGYLDEYDGVYSDPISHFTELAKKMTEEEKSNKSIELSIDMSEILVEDTNDLKNTGFLALSFIYHKLNIHTFLINRQRGLKSSLPLNNIMKLLVFERILNPGSKIAAYNNKELYFDKFNFSSRTMYRAFDQFSKHKENLLLDLHENIRMHYGRDTTNVFYDVTNYYFHIDQQTDLIRKGLSKDKKGKPIIQMGLLLDNAGIPINYKLFSGNTTDFETLLPVLSELKQEYRLNRIIVVADKGLNSGSNKAYNIIKGDGYIFSRSIRGTKANQDVKEYVLSKNDYREIGTQGFKIKSKVVPTEITINDVNGKNRTVIVDEKHVAFYSPKYDRRAKHKRNELIEKANKLISSKLGYTSASNYGALKYIVGLELDKATGELNPIDKKIKPFLDIDKISEEEKYDGYYSIVTSELDMLDEEIIERYRGLWQIEDTFKVTKTHLETRPVYVQTESSIEAHFLTCFLSLVILRLLEKELENLYPVSQLIKSLKKARVDSFHMNFFKAVYYDEVLKTIQEKLEIPFNKKYMTLSDIKNMISDTKNIS